MFESSNGDFDIQKTHINGQGINVITAGVANNGILGKTDVSAKVFEKKTITIDMFGNAFYRNFEYKMVTHARVFSLKPKFAISDRQGLFLSSAFHWFTQIYSYDVMCSWERIKDEKISLPTKDGAIDGAFMDQFITQVEKQRIVELEAQHMAELEAYLSVTGLKDYNLTEEEKVALKEYGDQSFEKFSIPSIFEVKNTHSILSSEIKENSGTTPYLCASSENNGVSSYISYNNKYKDTGNCVFIGGKTFVVSYQKDDFYSNDSHNLSLSLLEKEWKKREVQLYLATCVNKSLGYKYSWGDSISKSKIQTDKISLPNIGEKPDYEIMSVLIRAIQKLVIRDVVEYANSKIAATKQVCQ